MAAYCTIVLLYSTEYRQKYMCFDSTNVVWYLVPLVQFGTVQKCAIDIFEFHKEGYLLKWDISQRVSGREIRYVKLIPTEAESQSKYLLLGIDTNSKQLFKIIDLGINGTDTTFTVEEFTANILIDPKTFVFDKDKYANYYIDKF